MGIVGLEPNTLFGLCLGTHSTKSDLDPELNELVSITTLTYNLLTYNVVNMFVDIFKLINFFNLLQI